MQRTIRSLIGASFALLLLSEAASAAPCVTPTAACTEYVALRGGPPRVLVYRSHPLTTPVAEITHVIIAIHGAQRDAATSFRIAMAATVLAGGTDRTLVVAPRFAARAERGCEDDLAPGEANWACDVLVGELDTQVANGGFFGSCAALAQGATTRERGERFGKYMNAQYNARQTTAVVPGCGHSESCMFLSRAGMTALFPPEK